MPRPCKTRWPKPWPTSCRCRTCTLRPNTGAGLQQNLPRVRLTMLARAHPERSPMHIKLNVNGDEHALDVEPRTTLLDCLRDELGLKGAHAGCEHGVCGACTVLSDGVAIRSCLMFAVQAEGAEVTTVEGLSPDGALGPVQRAFRDEHGLQCGFCTPGFVVTAHAFLAEHPEPTRDEILEALSGNLCRCTGYQGIVRAVERAAASMGDDVT